MAETDFVTDILHRILPRHTRVARKTRDKIEREIRRDFGGDRFYIAKTGESAQAEITERNWRIYRQYRSGEHIALLARRWQMSERRIRQIVADCMTAEIKDGKA